MEPEPVTAPFAEQEQYEIITEVARAYPDKALEEITSSRSEYLGLTEEEYRERYGKYGRLEKAFADGRRLAKVDEKSGAERLKEYYKAIIVRLTEDQEILVNGKPLSKHKRSWEEIRKMGWGRLKHFRWICRLSTSCGNRWMITSTFPKSISGPYTRWRRWSSLPR